MSIYRRKNAQLRSFFLLSLPETSINILKYITSILLCWICQTAFCQDGFLPVNEQKNIYYSDFGTPDKNKAEIYKAVQDWVSHTFGNYQNAVKQQDPAEGKLMISSYLRVASSVYDYIGFDLIIECKDNQYRAYIEKLDGVSTQHSPVRLSNKENEAITTKEVAIKKETGRKARAEAEEAFKTAKADNESINKAMYGLLAGLKQFMVDGKTE